MCVKQTYLNTFGRWKEEREIANVHNVRQINRLLHSSEMEAMMIGRGGIVRPVGMRRRFVDGTMTGSVSAIFGHSVVNFAAGSVRVREHDYRLARNRVGRRASRSLAVIDVTLIDFTCNVSKYRENGKL